VGHPLSRSSFRFAFSGKSHPSKQLGRRLMTRIKLRYATMALTVSRATLSNGVGGLKCYDKGGIEKAC
jgi:hypothetical protein